MSSSWSNTGLTKAASELGLEDILSPKGKDRKEPIFQAATMIDGADICMTLSSVDELIEMFCHSHGVIENADHAAA
jgi:hypothetical protein